MTGLPGITQPGVYSDGELLTLWELWCERRYAAGFMQLAPDVVAAFRVWLGVLLDREPRHLYERHMLAEYHRQEAEINHD